MSSSAILRGWGRSDFLQGTSLLNLKKYGAFWSAKDCSLESEKSGWIPRREMMLSVGYARWRVPLSKKQDQLNL